MSIGTDGPQNKLIIHEESKEISPSLTDMKVLSVTWNMGGAEKPLFEGDQLSKLLPDVEQYGLVFVAAQECLQSKMTMRI